MPACVVNFTVPSFVNCLDKLGKKHHHVAADAGKALEKVAIDFLTACNGQAIPGFDRKIWKYRCGSSDMKKGASHGFRIIVYLHEPTKTLYPLFMYAKNERSDINGADIEKLVDQMELHVGMKRKSLSE